jgi:hypothetical protein
MGAERRRKSRDILDGTTGGVGIEGIKGKEAQRGPLWIYTVGWKTWWWCRFEDQALRDGVHRNGHSPVESWL